MTVHNYVAATRESWWKMGILALYREIGIRLFSVPIATTHGKVSKMLI